MKIKLYKRPGKNKKLMYQKKVIIDKLTGNWFTENVGQYFSVDLFYQDIFVLYEKKSIKSFLVFTCIDGFIQTTIFATNYEDMNKGYGSILYKYFEEYCVKNGFNKFLIQTVPEDVNKNYHCTIKFYEKHGYKITKRYKELWENGAIEMEKIVNI